MTEQEMREQVGAGLDQAELVRQTVDVAPIRLYPGSHEEVAVSPVTPVVIETAPLRGGVSVVEQGRPEQEGGGGGDQVRDGRQLRVAANEPSEYPVLQV